MFQLPMPGPRSDTSRHRPTWSCAMETLTHRWSRLQPMERLRRGTELWAPRSAWSWSGGLIDICLIFPCVKSWSLLIGKHIFHSSSTNQRCYKSWNESSGLQIVDSHKQRIHRSYSIYFLRNWWIDEQMLLSTLEAHQPHRSRPARWRGVWFLLGPRRMKKTSALGCNHWRRCWLANGDDWVAMVNDC